MLDFGWWIIAITGLLKFGISREASMPDGDKGLPVTMVGGLEGGKVFFATGVRLRGKLDSREVEAVKDFEKKDADRASIEIPEGVDGEESSFGEGEEFQQECVLIGLGTCPSGLKVAAIVAHLDRDLKRRRRLEPSDSYGDVAPAACPIGNKIAGNPVVEIEDQAFIQRVGGEPAFEHLGFQSGDAVGEQRGELGVAEDA
jgi:hypothetical protein